MGATFDLGAILFYPLTFFIGGHELHAGEAGHDPWKPSFQQGVGERQGRIHGVDGDHGGHHVLRTLVKNVVGAETDPAVRTTTE